jgi:hypothetical protein
MEEIVDINGIAISSPGGVIVSDDGVVWVPRPITKLADTQRAMTSGVQALMKVHKLSERDAASLMLTVTSAVDISIKKD